MPLDEPLAKAFSTIRQEVGYDVLGSVPHPENLRFQIDEERKAMRRLGMKLPEIVGNPDNEDLQYAAHAIRRYFGAELAMQPMPQFMADVPRFLLPADSRAAHRTNSQELAQQLGRMAIPQAEVICIVSAKLKLLQKLLHLSDAAIRLLALAYVVSGQYPRTNSLNCSIAMALEHISVQDEVHRNQAIAALLEVPLDEVTKMLTPPCCLKALRFVDSNHTNRVPTLRDSFILTDEFMDLLESTYRSHGALLQAILEPEQDLNLLNDDEVPIGHLYEILPKEVAGAFECAVLDRPLKSYHVDALVRWYSGGHRTNPSQYAPLAGRINVQTVREAIKRAALDCCIADVPLDAFALMRALYLAAVIHKT